MKKYSFKNREKETESDAVTTLPALHASHNWLPADLHSFHVLILFLYLWTEI